MVVFSDLDGSLLDHDTYDWRAAEPALDLLRRRHIPLVLVSSKTLAELADYRQQLALEHPVVAENGAAIDVPQGYFDDPPDALTLAVDRKMLRQAYFEAKAKLGIDGIAFFEMGIDGIVKATGLDAEQARRANDRQASEPILWRDSEAALAAFADAMREYGYRCVRGGRFVHLMPNTDKATATRTLIEAYQRQWPGEEITSVALGDGPNDIEMLESADIAVVIPGRHDHEMTLKRRDCTLRPQAEGPAGWNEAILSLLEPGEPGSMRNAEN